MTKRGRGGMGGVRLVYFHFENATAEVEGARKRSTRQQLLSPGERTAISASQACSHALWKVWIVVFRGGGGAVAADEVGGLWSIVLTS